MICPQGAFGPHSVGVGVWGGEEGRGGRYSNITLRQGFCSPGCVQGAVGS